MEKEKVEEEVWLSPLPTISSSLDNRLRREMREDVVLVEAVKDALASGIIEFVAGSV